MIEFLTAVSWSELALSIFTLVFGYKWLCTEEGVKFIIGLVNRKGFISILLAVLGVLSYVASGAGNWKELSAFLVIVAGIFCSANVVGDHGLFRLGKGKK